MSSASFGWMVLGSVIPSPGLCPCACSCDPLCMYVHVDPLCTPHPLNPCGRNAPLCILHLVGVAAAIRCCGEQEAAACT